MDYLEIILKGLGKNERNYLSKYFYREFKKAETNHYEAEEFFSGCLSAIDMLEQNLKNQMNDRKRELYLTISLATDRTLTFEDTKGMTHDELCQESISRCETELKEISINDFTVNLSSLKMGYTGYIFGYDVFLIKSAIIEAQKDSVPIQPAKEFNNQITQLSTNLSYNQREELYDSLVKGKFIDETNKDNFIWALGKTDETQPLQWQPIKWIESKQALRELLMLESILKKITNQHIRDIERLFIDKAFKPFKMSKAKEFSARCIDIETIGKSLIVKKNPNNPGAV